MEGRQSLSPVVSGRLAESAASPLTGVPCSVGATCRQTSSRIEAASALRCGGLGSSVVVAEQAAKALGALEAADARQVASLDEPVPEALVVAVGVPVNHVRSGLAPLRPPAFLVPGPGARSGPAEGAVAR